MAQRRRIISRWRPEPIELIACQLVRCSASRAILLITNSYLVGACLEGRPVSLPRRDELESSLLGKPAAVQVGALGNVAPVHDQSAELLVAPVDLPGSIVAGAGRCDHLLADLMKGLQHRVVEELTPWDTRASSALFPLSAITAAAPIPIPNSTEKNAVRSSRRKRCWGQQAELGVNVTVRMHSFLQQPRNSAFEILFHIWLEF